MKIYIAGRMVGFKYYNFPLFMEKEEELRLGGWDVINPARLDMNAGLEPREYPEDHDWSSPPKSVLKDIIKRDCDALINEADAIYMMKGWEGGTGAPAEHGLAKWLGLEIIYE